MKTLLALLGIIFLIYLAVKFEVINPNFVQKAKAEVHQLTQNIENGKTN